MMAAQAEDRVPTTYDDHDRVMAIPSYRRWHDAMAEWRYAWERRQGHRADKMRKKAEAKYRAELERIAEWKGEHASTDASYKAWSAENDRRYWKLRRV